MTRRRPGRQRFCGRPAGLLDHLGIESAHLVAQSMGGRTMLGFAVAYPNRVKSLVMADTVGGMDVRRCWNSSAAGGPGAEKQAANPSANGEIGFRAVSPLFVQRNPNLANLYLQVSPHQPTPAQPARWDADRPQRGAVGEPWMFRPYSSWARMTRFRRLR